MIRLGHAPRTPIRVMGHDPIPQLVSVGHDLSFQLGALGHDPHPCAPPGAVPPFATCTLPSDAESLFVFIGYCRGTQRKQEFHTLRACFLFWAMAPIGPQILYMQGLWSCPFPPPRIRSVPLPFPLSLSLCVPLPLPLPLPLRGSHPHFHFHFHFHSHSHSYSPSNPPSLCPSLSLCSLPLPLSLCPSQSHKTNANEDCSPPPRVTSAQSPLVTTAHTTRCAPWLIIPKPPPPRRAVARARVDPERP